MQEHWLPKQSLSYLNSVHSDFSARGISSIDYGDGLPVSVTIFVKLLPTSEASTTKQTCRTVPASSQDLLNDYSKTGSLLSGIDVPQAVMMKPISYYYAIFLMILILLLTLPM